MVMVKCKACGKRYDYKQHGCCPACGAYNRPPQRNRVGADGIVHHMSDRDFLDNTRDRRRSQGSKVCFEQDVCYEEQARKVRSGGKPWEEPLNTNRSRMRKQRKTRAAGKKKPVGAAIAIAILVSILPSILAACRSFVANINIGDIEEVFTETVQAKPDRKNGTSYIFEDVSVGEKFRWWDEETVVTEYTIDPDAAANYQVTVTVEGEDLWDMPMLYYWLPDGTLAGQPCDLETYISESAHQYSYQAPDMHAERGCYLEFCGYNGDENCTTTVWLP